MNNQKARRPVPASPLDPQGSDYERRGAFYLVALMSILYALSLLDRLIMGMLVDPVQRDLGISDAQIGMLIGTSFAMMYSLAGLPIAYFLDRTQRRRIMFAGVLLWSCSTIASAFAPSFPYLFAGRMGLAIGEAVLTPAAVSLFADVFTDRRRATAMSVYGAIGTVMGVAAFALGAVTLDVAALLSPAMGGLAPWRVTLILVGLPGVVLAPLILLTLKEPRRRTQASSDPDHAPDIIRYLRGHWRLFLPFYVGIGVFAMYSYSLTTWFPTLLVREFELSAAESGGTVNNWFVHDNAP